jgi:ketosteroid isomerase-like protein
MQATVMPASATSNGADASKKEFVEYFAETWGRGAGPAFLERFEARMHPEVVLIQPLSRSIRGRDGFRRAFERLFRAIPDLRGEVHGWGPTPDGVMIEMALEGTLGKRPVEWPLVDVIRLEGSLIRERRSYFDSLPLIRALAFEPRIALSILRTN